MQDAHVLLPDMSACLSALPGPVSRVSYFAVFDGHGGARASRFAAEHLHHNLAKKFPVGTTLSTENVDKLIKKCLLDTFRQTDEDFLRKASSQKPAWKDGSTATCVLVVDDMVYVANLGDSRVHGDGRVLGVLEVSRSIGDGQYKRIGVISSPDMRRLQLTANDRQEQNHRRSLLIGYSRNPSHEGSVEQRPRPTEEEEEEEVRFEAACQQLASEAVRRGCADNVTVILLSIGF
ncbi:hypothetical protein PFLUV_G00015100 [Perca fluviatilis]|uniref:PPM-type phosphatase domain-containing protein n=1 Tax=Perca fluviatilis TaxID=8168 RepID=A0A6A5EUW9_PERFL|nr:hypothetical protein PFLUV_G00015100 [Perca fluviatilis]